MLYYMLMRILKDNRFLFIIVGILLVVPFSGFAQSLDLSSVIKQLQEQIEALQKQVVSLQSQLQVAKEEIAEVKTELKLTNSLVRGSFGDEVRALQEFLKQFPDIYPSGLVTGYFGPQTELAVKKLQEKQGIEAVGIVGPKTLSKINELIAYGAGTSGVVPPGLLIAPGIQAKLATTTILIVSSTSPNTTTTLPVVALPLPLPVTSSTSPFSTTTTPVVTPAPVVTSTPAPATPSIAPVFSVASPASGATWNKGNTYSIQWSNTGLVVSNVRISLYKNGATYSSDPFIAIDVPNSGSYSWQVFSSLSDDSNYSVRVFNSAYPNNWGDSGLFSIIATTTATTATTTTSTATTTTTTTATTTTTTTPIITVTYPNGGETLGYLSYGFYYNSSNVSRVGFKVLKGSQTVYESTTPTTAGTRLSFSPFPDNSAWSAYQSGSDYKIRVFDWDNSSVYDDSNNYFSVDVTDPVVSNLSVSPITENSAVITWTTDEPANSQVNYGSTSSNWALTPIDYTKVTSHSVTLTGLTSGTLYKYRVMSTDDLGNTTQTPTYPSEYTFTTTAIAASVTITYPNGGETWETGQNYTITWNSTGNINGVLLFLANEAGQVFVTNLVNVYGNPGSTQWGVSSSFLGRYRILIHGCSALNCTVGNTKSTESSVASDLSDSYFNIVSATSSANLANSNLASLLELLASLLQNLQQTLR